MSLINSPYHHQGDLPLTPVFSGGAEGPCQGSDRQRLMYRNPIRVARLLTLNKSVNEYVITQVATTDPLRLHMVV